MLERCCELGFLQEAFTPPPVGGELGSDELQGNVALQARVVRFVDATHTTAADQRLEAVTKKFVANPRIYRARH
jgi:hypothetical protein